MMKIDSRQWIRVRNSALRNSALRNSAGWLGALALLALASGGLAHAEPVQLVQLEERRDCPFQGDVRYTLARAENPTPVEQMAYERIERAMDGALEFYNCFTNIQKQLRVSFVPSVQTADGNFNGSIRFGGDPTFMDFRTAMHEIAHTVGVGQAPNWNAFVQNGRFVGENALRQLQAINASLETPLDTVVNADRQHFWPYGINRQSEVRSEADLIAHCLMVMAIRRDLGLQDEGGLVEAGLDRNPIPSAAPAQ